MTTRTLALLIGTACALAPAASAQVLHHGRLHHAVRARVVRGDAPAPYGYVASPGGGFNDGAAQVPPRGFYNGYEGPGSTVLRRGVAAQYEPGATAEIAPDAKQTATGGPVGGLPGSSGP